jgi:threonine dehydratase
MITGYRCIGCGTYVSVATAWPWRCPRPDDDTAHVLRIETTGAFLPVADDRNPFIAYRTRMAWHAFALACGLSDADTVSLVRDVDNAIAAVDGRGFVETPFPRAAALSDALRFAPTGGIWVKDETGNVAGSHKARHLMGVLLHLLVAERTGRAPSATRARLAVASCGNAAVAAATLAAAVGWPIDVFVPPQADPVVLDRLDRLGAHVVACPRRANDRAGDPCLHRFREAVGGGAIPFSVQGPENSLCIDGGRTLGWEILRQLDGERLDRVFVQVGGGALATAIGDAFIDDPLAGGRRPVPRLHAVQAAGCAPLAKAWHRVGALGLSPTETRELARRAGDCMHAWPHPASAAAGILDDETYDWLSVVRAMAVTGGGPVVTAECEIVDANSLAATTTAIRADHTGTAGLAGVCTLRAEIDDSERVAVLFTGTFRDSTTADGAI